MSIESQEWIPPAEPPYLEETLSDYLARTCAHGPGAPGLLSGTLTEVPTDGEPKERAPHTTVNIVKSLLRALHLKATPAERITKDAASSNETISTWEYEGETEIEREARVARERLYRTAILALASEKQREKLYQGDESVLPKLVRPKTYDPNYDDTKFSNGFPVEITPVFWADNFMNPVELFYIQISTVLRVHGEGLKQAWITLRHDDLSKSRTKIHKTTGVTELEVHPVDADIVVAQVGRAFNVTARELDAYDPFDKQG
jgi:hypothetical protein